jgi:ABC-2 type transport system permease protein
MTARAVRIGALARLELADVRGSRWLAVCAGLYAVLAASFVLIGLRESEVVGFTGMTRVLGSLAHALVVLLPLLALAGTGLVVNRAREGGALELLLSHPFTRGEYIVAVTLVRFGALLVPLLVLLPGLALAGGVADRTLPWAFLVRTLAVSATLIWAFVGIGLAISTAVREPARAIVYVLAAWALGVALLDFGLIGAMLQWRLRPEAVFALAALNPVESARLALLAGADGSLETLGPVGVFLVRQVGAGGLFAAGVIWPAAVGTLAWLLAWRRLNRMDVV